jgi:hypothetical protein
VAIAHQMRIAIERAATAREPRRAHAARRAEQAVAGALAELERLILADRAAQLAERSRTLLAVPGTVTPAERAWVLGGHLLAATARLHDSASAGGRPIFGERQSARAWALTHQAMRELQCLLAPPSRRALRAALTPGALSLDAQLRLFAPLLLPRSPHPRRANAAPAWPPQSQRERHSDDGR